MQDYNLENNILRNVINIIHNKKISSQESTLSPYGCQHTWLARQYHDDIIPHFRVHFQLIEEIDDKACQSMAHLSSEIINCESLRLAQLDTVSRLKSIISKLKIYESFFTIIGYHIKEQQQPVNLRQYYDNNKYQFIENRTILDILSKIQEMSRVKSQQYQLKQELYQLVEYQQIGINPQESLKSNILKTTQYISKYQNYHQLPKKAYNPTDIDILELIFSDIIDQLSASDFFTLNEVQSKSLSDTRLNKKIVKFLKLIYQKRKLLAGEIQQLYGFINSKGQFADKEVLKQDHSYMIQKLRQFIKQPQTLRQTIVCERCQQSILMKKQRLQLQLIVQSFLKKIGNSHLPTNFNYSAEFYKQQFEKIINTIDSIGIEPQKCKEQSFQIKQQFEINDRVQQINQLMQRLQNQSKDKDMLQRQKYAILNQKQKLNVQIQQLRDQLNTILTLKGEMQNSFIDQIQILKSTQKQQLEAQKVKRQIEESKRVQIAKKEKQIKLEKDKIKQKLKIAEQQAMDWQTRYCNEIGKRLNQSRMDQSRMYQSRISISEKGVGTSFLKQNVLSELNQDDNFREHQSEESAQLVKEIEDNLKIRYEKNILQKEDQILQLKNRILDLQNQLRIKSAHLCQSQKKIELQSALLSDNKIQYDILYKKYQDFAVINKRYEEQLAKNVEKNRSSDISQAFQYPLISSCSTLFQSDIFDEDFSSKSILIKHINNYMKSKIVKTLILYKYDQFNKTNFHTYIDHKECLVCLVKTKNAIIAGFYPGKLDDRHVLNEGGLLISVSNDQSFTLKASKPGQKIIYRGMSYDQYYTIFGNAQIRIKTGEKKIFSNFGISTSYFDYGDAKKVDFFLKEGEKKEVEFEQCEFYQVIFSESQRPNKNLPYQQMLYQTC